MPTSPEARPRALALALPLLILAALAVAVAVALTSVRGGATVPGAAAACPPGYEPTGREPAIGARLAAERYGAAAELAGASEGPVAGAAAECARLDRPEGFTDLALANGLQASKDAAPFTSVRPGAYAAAIAQKQALAANAAAIPGTAGDWVQRSTTPLKNNVPEYTRVAGSGFRDVAGRINDFAYDPVNKRIFAAVANGGVWVTGDRGANWTSIGDSLPTQIMGAVAYSSADGGTVIAVTGDGAFGGSSNAGAGVYRISGYDGGNRTWTKSVGVPDGLISFKAAVDPANANIVYAATGGGLFRSVDAGATFVNVNLPTGAGVVAGQPNCTGTSATKGCFLANMVTDVVVLAPGGTATPATAAGRVVAVVGWRAGTKVTSASPFVQSPNNGVYVSNTGAVGSFTKAALPTGVAQDQFGRASLGATTGALQNHNYLYMVLEDARKFRGTATADLLDTPAPTRTVLSGTYVSSDAGATWQLMEDGEVIASDPTNKSSLTVGAAAASLYAPGVQSWYNSWIEVDPTRQAAGGVPTRVAFGLEEIWQNKNPANTDLVGVGPGSQFEVVGAYTGDGSCFFLTLQQPACPTDGTPLNPNTTTHPDHHAGLFIPDATGGVSLFSGNDGGAYVQSVAKNTAMTNAGWGNGIQGSTPATTMHTLLPYQASMANDGTVWGGLQDNGQMKIEPDGTTIATFGGDGFFAATEPADSKVAYEEVTNGAMSVTTNGGRAWTSINPSLTNPLFSTPFVMDGLAPTSVDASRHLMVGGRNIKERTGGPSGAWTQVYDLGTAGGDADPPNQLSAVDLRGDAAYVGYCGFCDTVTQGTPFKSGIATNVGGDKAPKRLTGDGWHIIKDPVGLPERYINGVTIDPRDSNVVYAALGGYGRKWAPPGAVGEDAQNVGVGHVFKSTDAGKSFTDISGTLPDVPANAVLVRPNGQLLVATDIGVFAANGTDGGAYAPLGTNLPTAPVVSLQLKPDDASLLVAATYGRGVYTYTFPDGAGVTAPSSGGTPTAPIPPATNAGPPITPTTPAVAPRKPAAPRLGLAFNRFGGPARRLAARSARRGVPVKVRAKIGKAVTGVRIVMYRFVTPKRRRVVATLTKPFTATRKAKIVYLRLTSRKAIVKGNYLVVATGNPAGPVRRASTSNRFRLR